MEPSLTLGGPHPPIYWCIVFWSYIFALCYWWVMPVVFGFIFRVFSFIWRWFISEKTEPVFKRKRQEQGQFLGKRGVKKVMCYLASTLAFILMGIGIYGISGWYGLFLYEREDILMFALLFSIFLGVYLYSWIIVGIEGFVLEVIYNDLCKKDIKHWIIEQGFVVGVRRVAILLFLPVFTLFVLLLPAFLFYKNGLNMY